MAYDQRTFEDLVCPNCRTALLAASDSLRCKRCGGIFPIKYGTPDFRTKDEYWCNVSRDKMRNLIDAAKATNDWFSAAKKFVPEYMSHFSSLERADCQFLWPTKPDSRILDAGSMWGGITIPAAQFHGEVYALDKTAETLELLNLRAKELGLKNIRTVASGLDRLPFADNYFDLVVLSGVLEWVALDEKVVLEKQWGRFGFGFRPGNTSKNREGVTETQLKVLKEIRRVLKPEGCLYLAIENSIGYIYLLGFPDDHMNLPFLSFLPRFIANAITRLLLGCEYRTYVYSIPQYKALLESSGFGLGTFYGAFMHYIRPTEVVPLELISPLKGKLEETKKGINRIIFKLIPKGLLKWVPPSIIIIAPKNRASVSCPPRLIGLLKAAGILKGNDSGFDTVKCFSRSGNLLTANYLIYDKAEQRIAYFCKISRQRTLNSPLALESNKLSSAKSKLQGTDLEHSIPNLIHYGTIDAISFMVTDYFDARRTTFNFPASLHWKLKDLDREIRKAIDFLVRFQKHTKTREVPAVPYLASIVADQKRVLEDAALLSEDVLALINRLSEDIAKCDKLNIPLCAQHGDYDFFYNIVFVKGKVCLLDFEHFLDEALPFLDLITLIFNPIISSSEANRNGFAHTLLRHHLPDYLNEWFGLYADQSEMPKEILRLSPALAALEQGTRTYPESRDPKGFPINSVFKEMLGMRAPV